MRLGGPVFGNLINPEAWVQELKKWGYRAAYCPVSNDVSDSVIEDYTRTAQKEDIIIAEVGAWSNPISSDKAERDKALSHCKKQLELAERIGARCCVNIAGSRGEQWDGPHMDNLSDETFDMIVDTVREIIDAVKPDRTYYTLEPMPWVFPESADSYLRLIKAIDRKQFAAHVDIVNVINSPVLYYNNAALAKEWFSKLGPYIKSCHAKDISLSGKLTVHLDEVRPGLGAVNYSVLLQELNKIDADTPLMIEHLKQEEEYRLSRDYIRGEMDKLGIK